MVCNEADRVQLPQSKGIVNSRLDEYDEAEKGAKGIY